MSWLVQSHHDCTITIKVVPRASRTEICGSDALWLRVRLQAPPVDGKANAALVEFLAKTFDLPKRSVEILAGDTTRVKRVKLHGITPEAVIAAVREVSK